MGNIFVFRCWNESINRATQQVIRFQVAQKKNSDLSAVNEGCGFWSAFYITNVTEVKIKRFRFHRKLFHVSNWKNDIFTDYKCLRLGLGYYHTRTYFLGTFFYLRIGFQSFILQISVSHEIIHLNITLRYHAASLIHVYT